MRSNTRERLEANIEARYGENCTLFGGRAQTEVTGVVLLTAVVVIVVAVAGITILGTVDTQDDPATNFDVTITASDVKIAHQGGTSLTAADVTVILRSDTTTERYSVADFQTVDGSAEGVFEAGERRNHTHGMHDSARVLVVHDPSNTVLFDRDLDILVSTTPNQPPIADIAVSPAIPTEGEIVALDARDSTDPDGSIIAYEWDLDGDGSYDETGMILEYVFAQPGNRTVRMRVTDDSGVRSITSQTITVSPANIDVSSAILTADGEEAVKPGDSVTVAVAIENGVPEVDTVTAIPEAFDAGSVSLSDDTGDGTYEGTFTVGSDPVDGTRTATIDIRSTAGNTTTVETNPLIVDSTPPNISDTSLSDDDGDGFVTVGDAVTISATVSDGGSGVETVQANAKAFGASSVELTDDDGDGTYDATITVGNSPTEGQQAVSITATDGVGLTATAETAGSLIVDTTAPEIATFSVEDQSEFNFALIYWEFVESFAIQWDSTDAYLDETTVYINRTGTVRTKYSGQSGGETYENTRPYQTSGHEYTITIVAVDEAGNRACRTVTDVADGTDPPASAFESCSAD